MLTTQCLIIFIYCAPCFFFLPFAPFSFSPSALLSLQYDNEWGYSSRLVDLMVHCHDAERA